MSTDILQIIVSCTREVGEEQEINLPGDLGSETRLFGREGLFDSVGLVSLVVAVEEAIEDQFGQAVSLADERAMSQSKSPFRSIGTLAEYANVLIAESQ